MSNFSRKGLFARCVQSSSPVFSIVIAPFNDQLRINSKLNYNHRISNNFFIISNSINFSTIRIDNYSNRNNCPQLRPMRTRLLPIHFLLHYCIDVAHTLRMFPISTSLI